MWIIPIARSPREAIKLAGPGGCFCSDARIAMTEFTDPRRKRILYRATHRGTKESDAVIGGWIKAALPSIPEARLGEVEELLEELDLDLMDWLMGRLPIPERWRNSVFDEVLLYYRQLGSEKSS